VDLIHVSRAFQLNQQVIRGRDDLIGKAIQSLGGRV
jgi:flagellar basal body rod protein FlgG